MAKQYLRAVCFKLAESDHTLLDLAAEKLGASRAAVVRTLIRAYLRPQLLGARLLTDAQAELIDGLSGPQPAQTDLERPLVDVLEEALTP
jgi:hypothetical protein